MGKMKDLLQSGIGVTRRTFMQGAAVVGSAAALVGCSKNDTQDIIYGGGTGGLDNSVPAEDLSNPDVYYARCVHNCGAGTRCISKIHVVNGRVVRVTTDESDYAFDGSYRDKNQYNDSRSLSCAKGRAYKYKLYNSARLRYPLKQTKQRGDLTGFIRITPAQAMKEIAQKYRSIYTMYGPGAIYNTYGTSASYGGTFSNPADARSALTYVGSTRGAYSDYSFHQYNYAQPLTGHPEVRGLYGSNASNVGSQMPAIAGVVKNIVSWGTNILSTNNTVAYPYIRAIEKMKERHSGAKVYFIGPELVDTGVTCHTDWVQLRNYTDTALIMSMMYEMLINTFNTDGSVKADAWLDVNYLDTMVYGFFDSPEYWVMTTDNALNVGEISLTEQTGTGWRKVEAVPAGRSLSAYVMGDDTRLTKSQYVNAANYNAQSFASVQAQRNGAVCSYPVTLGGNTQYLYKKDMLAPKTPEWAEKICGTPAQTIRDLAKMYCDPAQHPIFNEWCGGVQKQDNGVVNIFAIAALMCVTKTFGLNGEGLYGPWASNIPNPGDRGADTDYLSDTGTGAGTPTTAGKLPPPVVPALSCKEWFNGIKIGFHDVLKEKQYSGKYVPNWDGTTRYLNDDCGAKASIKWKWLPDGKIDTYIDSADGLTYYDFEGRDTTGTSNHSPVFVGTRMIISSGGGIQLNQHMNTNDNAEMYKCLPVGTDSANADTFCLVQFDPYMSPTARFADYVLPATMALEAGDWFRDGCRGYYNTSISTKNIYYRPPVAKALGDTLDGWTWAYEAYKAQDELGSFNGINTTGAHRVYVKSTAMNDEYVPAETWSLKVVDDAIANPASRFYKMTRQDVYEKQFRSRKNQPELIETAEVANNAAGKIRLNLNAYIALDDAARKITPFVFTKFGDNVTVNTFAAAVSRDWAASSGNTAEDVANERPQAAGRFQVYNGMAVWDYEHRYSKYHGWLPKNKRGQTNKDFEGDMMIYQIPLYVNFEDSFREAYAGFSGQKNSAFFNEKLLTLGTTHDRFRVHSTNNENPYMRELNHRTKNGKWASGNDWNEYCIVPERQTEGSSTTFSQMVSTAIENKDIKTASWHEIWVNTQDAAERGIVDGDLIRVENPIGAVRVIARVTSRCIKGHVNLHQGGWYDPNPIDGVDDGGCANTLMSCKPSRYDNGNSQQFAYVTIKKETSF